MLKVEGVVSNFFQLVLRVFSKLAPDTIDKSLGVPKVFLEEVLKLRPRDWSSAFMVALVLGPSETDGATEKNGGKENTIHFYGAWSLEIIFTLLTKVIAIYVRFSGIGLRGLSFEQALSRLY